MSAPRVGREQAVGYRLAANHLARRLPAGAYARAARYALQDTAPRDALVALHARTADCEPTAWEHEDLVQTYSPRAAVHVLPRDDLGVFTVGRLPLDPDARQALETLADEVCRDLGGQERQGAPPPQARPAAATGRILVRWTTSALFVREVPRPAVDPGEARRELLRRHLRSCAPSTPGAYAWWAGLGRADAEHVWAELAAELTEVDVQGRRAWVLTADLDLMLEPPRASGVRLLAAPDRRLLGVGRDGLFVGPGTPPPGTLFDTFHPGAVLLDGVVVGSWGRRARRFDIRVGEGLPETRREEVVGEAERMPIPGDGEWRVELSPVAG